MKTETKEEASSNKAKGKKDEDEETGSSLPARGEPRGVIGGGDSVVPNDGPVESNNNGNPKLSRLQKVGILGIILVAFALALGFGIPAILDASSDDEEPTATQSPSQVPSTTSQKNLTSRMKEFALTLSISETLDDPSSPQSKAVEWLVEDELEHQRWWATELTQRYVLAVLYHSTGGDEWSRFDQSSWFQATSVCQWGRAVECNPRGAITSIHLWSDNLKGTIPIEIGALTAIEELRLVGKAFLTGPIPSEFGQLTKMTKLWLFDNALAGPIPSELGQLTALRELNSHDNALSGPIPSELGLLTAMESLWLSNNALSGRIPSEVGRLTTVNRLFLTYNHLTGPIPSELGRLTRRASLYLNDNALTGTVPNELTQLTNLEYLDLHNNDLTGTVPSGFCAAPFPDWRNHDWGILATDCISQIQCDCCNFCYDEAGNCFEWSNSEGDFVSSTTWPCD